MKSDKNINELMSEDVFSEREELEKLGFEYDQGNSELNVNTDIMEKLDKHVSIEWPPMKNGVYKIFWENGENSGEKTIKSFKGLKRWVEKFL